MQINIKTWIENFDNGKYNNSSVSTQIEAGWYDWFCRDSSLMRKTIKLGKKLKQIAGSRKIDTEKQYVWFKNNCPCVGTLYDDFRIADIETGDVLYTIVPKSGHSVDNGAAQLWGHDNGFTCPLMSGTWRDVVKFFND